MGPTQARQSADHGKFIVRRVGSLGAQSALNAVFGLVLLASLVRVLLQSDCRSYSSVQATVGIAGAFSSFGLIRRGALPGSLFFS